VASVFTKIINREIPGHIVAEDERFIAILDVSPLVIGHVLVIPKKQQDYIFDLEDEELSGLTLFTKKVANAMKATIHCKRIGVAVIGLEVAHVHIHLVPMNTMGDINFMRAKLAPSKEELAATADQIKRALK
jgi:histidine triad (HIT) family protein